MIIKITFAASFCLKYFITSETEFIRPPLESGNPVFFSSWRLPPSIELYLGWYSLFWMQAVASTDTVHFIGNLFDLIIYNNVSNYMVSKCVKNRLVSKKSTAGNQNSTQIRSLLTHTWHTRNVVLCKFSLDNTGQSKYSRQVVMEDPDCMVSTKNPWVNG